MKYHPYPNCLCWSGRITLLQLHALWRPVKAPPVIANGTAIVFCYISFILLGSDQTVFIVVVVVLVLLLVVVLVLVLVVVLVLLLVLIVGFMFYWLVHVLAVMTWTRDIVSTRTIAVVGRRLGVSVGPDRLVYVSLDGVCI